MDGWSLLLVSVVRSEPHPQGKAPYCSERTYLTTRACKWDGQPGFKVQRAAMEGQNYQ